jgi:hypothetical protein
MRSLKKDSLRRVDDRQAKDVDRKVGRVADVSAPRVQDHLTEVSQRLTALEQDMRSIRESLLCERLDQEWFNTTEFGKLVNRTEFTVRQWCNKSRLKAGKIGNGRAWRIHRSELTRYRRDGLLPA